MPPLETRTDSTGETPEVPQDPCQHWRGMLRFRHRLHTRSEAPASTGRNPERPASNSHGDWPFLRPQERDPEVPVVSREHLLCAAPKFWEFARQLWFREPEKSLPPGLDEGISTALAPCQAHQWPSGSHGPKEQCQPSLPRVFSALGAYRPPSVSGLAGPSSSDTNR